MKEDNNEYQEKLSNQIEQIRKCIYKNNLSDKKKIQCVINTFNKNTFSKKVISKNTFNKSIIKTKNTFSKKVISKTPEVTKTQKKMNNNVPRVSQNKKKEVKTEKEIKVKEEKMNNNVPRVEQNKEIKPENMPITIDTIGLYINSIKNK
jgi:hypothetical protein